ncbi:hypothetical protein, partial [Pseudomonas syringae group genomosp. 7]|uniref:hypothetical protein n=1 Tax=Pseudomonas syringae group genomosp. 7 TaxID=251699 RepID=UPI003770040D
VSSPPRFLGKNQEGGESLLKAKRTAYGGGVVGGGRVGEALTGGAGAGRGGGWVGWWPGQRAGGGGVVRWLFLWWNRKRPTGRASRAPR